MERLGREMTGLVVCLLIHMNIVMEVAVELGLLEAMEMTRALLETMENQMEAMDYNQISLVNLLGMPGKRVMIAFRFFLL